MFGEPAFAPITDPPTSLDRVSFHHSDHKIATPLCHNIANVMEVRDALNEAYATASMISAEATNVSCTQDFNSYAEMLYNRLNGDEFELMARWQGFESLGNLR
ncbi:unnamed protein product [Phytophthora fragariaefolia]|uniref:Unnamed protein product n=1 Tax=Phytophthora fragariaefolia TaxID=1490495 RepID=A0A9W6YLU3_9STRA|nr:unnamed protein product [Phytophthora fragariaefolia]